MCPIDLFTKIFLALHQIQLLHYRVLQFIYSKKATKSPTCFNTSIYLCCPPRRPQVINFIVYCYRSHMVARYSAMIKMNTMDLSASDLMIFLKIMCRKNQKLDCLLMYCLRLEKLDQNLPQVVAPLNLTGQLYGKGMILHLGFIGHLGLIGIVEVLD